MTRLIYYVEEREKYREEQKPENRLDYDSIHIVIKKLYRHYKLGEPSINITSGNRHSNCGGRHITINMEDAYIHTIAHEVAHALQYKKGFYKTKAVKDAEGNITDYKKVRRNAHGKWHERLTEKILRYCIKHNYWKEERDRRLAPKPEKPAKPEPTKEELQSKELERLRKLLSKYDKKIKLYQVKRRTLQTKINRKSAWIRKAQQVRAKPIWQAWNNMII